MNKKTLLKEIGNKLENICNSLRSSHSEMSDQLGIGKSTYTRNETGETAPNPLALNKLGNNFDVSLDWLICNKGPMYYKEKKAEKQTELPGKTLQDDLNELLEHMEHIPLLRYEILVLFYKFKEANKEVVESAMRSRRQ
jgi:transcriptional regulator with XRE-family HTH domain